jgi:hypothetical protein
VTWHPETTFPTNSQDRATKGGRLATVSLALGVLGLVWYFLAPALGLLLGAPFELDMLDVWPL